jgi:hypothetical protein
MVSHDHYQPCIDACIACAEACEQCAAACEREDSAKMARCISLNTDCAAMCRLAADFMTRNSQYVDLICEDCAEICKGCADECNKYPQDHCQDCALACLQCAQECLKMAVH